MISQLSNKLFYDGRLVDGISNTDREPLISLPPVAFMDTRGTEKQNDDNSYYNELEISVVKELVSFLTCQGVAYEEIGIIALCTS